MSAGFGGDVLVDFAAADEQRAVDRAQQVRELERERFETPVPEYHNSPRPAPPWVVLPEAEWGPVVDR